MLVLSRKVDEVIRIGDNIEIKVVRIGNGAVRLGINAPRDVPIVRPEVLERSTNSGPRDISDGGSGSAGDIAPLSFCDRPGQQMLGDYCKRRHFWRTRYGDPLFVEASDSSMTAAVAYL